MSEKLMISMNSEGKRTRSGDETHSDGEDGDDDGEYSEGTVSPALASPLAVARESELTKAADEERDAVFATKDSGKEPKKTFESEIPVMNSTDSFQKLDFYNSYLESRSRSSHLHDEEDQKYIDGFLSGQLSTGLNSTGLNTLNSVDSAESRTMHNEWEWLRTTKHIKVEKRLRILQSISQMLIPHEYWVYRGTKRTTLSKKRILRNIVMCVTENSTFWQRQIFGSWRKFSLSFMLSQWNFSTMSLVKDPGGTILHCGAPMNFDTRQRSFSIYQSDVKEGSFSNVSNDKTIGRVVRTIRHGRYHFDVYENQIRYTMRSPSFSFEPHGHGECLRMCCGKGKTRSDEVNDLEYRSNICTKLRHCVSKSTCMLCGESAPLHFRVRENTSALHGKGVLRGPIVADFHKEQGFFHLHFRKMLHASGDTSVLDKKKLIFAASFYVEITSYAIGELPHGGTTKGLVQKYLGYSKEADEEESASKTE